MNVLEYEMVDILKKLKNEYGVIEIKAEYENEGSRADELMRLKDVVSKVDLPILVKIGGVEAVSDMYNAITLGVGGIVAPMAETRFAVSKFTHSIETFVADDNRKDIDFAVNIETITAYKNLDDILLLPSLHALSGVTVGRVDFTASMDKDRSFANSETMLHYCKSIFERAKRHQLICGLGGAVSPESEHFIQELIQANLLDKYETRKVVYDQSGIENFSEGILLGIQFELLWLKSKRRYYHRIKSEDERRIEMLQARLNS